MGFWIFMLTMNLWIPFSMVAFGSYFCKSAGPGEINMLFGYRTTMSMKNKDTWAFAHLYCGRLWRTVGWAMVPATLVAMLFLLGKEEHAVGIGGSVIMGVQLVGMLAPIFPTEAALRKRFDKEGNIKNRDAEDKPHP